MAILNTVRVATQGLGGITFATGYRTAFPEINFYDIFPEPDEVRHLRLGGVVFEEEVGSITVISTNSLADKTLISLRSQDSGGGAATSQAKKRRREVEIDYNWRRITRVRAFSIKSEEYVNNAQIIELINTKSIVENVTLGMPSITMGVNDEEEIIMMLLAA